MKTAHVTMINTGVLSSRDRHYLNMALDQALKSDCTNRHGAVIVVNGAVVGKSPNKFRNHPSVVSPEHVKTGCTVHAEVAAIKKANTGLRGATIYVARAGKFGPLLSRPCARCYDELLRAGITEIIHT
jgi:deoxycytidylate deaminase